ncbi:MAG: alpha-glucan family phosphorylase, partial [Anaerolineales bacterium]
MSAATARTSKLPRRINRLAELSHNLWWSWNPRAQRLFRRLDENLWRHVNHNPVKFLNIVTRATLNGALRDRWFLEQYDRVLAAFDEYLNAADTWFSQNYPDLTEACIAYFSPEFGLHESLPIYAGGLGVLSGDHSKEASDLGLPFVGVGFIYQQGYFHQHIMEDGWQEASWETLDYDDQAVVRAVDADGNHISVEVSLPGRMVSVAVWKLQVGRIPLYLMDTNVEGNSATDRELTARLYSSDLDVRIAQEIVLGIGGVRALRALGLRPNVWHMNEGHSAFMILERIAEKVQQGLTFDEAARFVRSSTVFTTHTPVPAGNEAFPDWLIEKYLPNYWERMGLDRNAFMSLARLDRSWGPAFSMPILALRSSGYRNGVSALHGSVSRNMWHFLWPDRDEADVPIRAITNGIHTDSWLARRYGVAFDKYLGANWRDHLDEPEVWQAVQAMPDTELWNIHRHLKRKLLAFMRDRSREAWTTTRVHPVQTLASGALLDHNAFTIGFARRFATYKRAGLLFRDFERMLQLLHRPGMPVQIIFSGKAHPADEPAKRLIQDIYRQIKKAECGGRLVFIEDYDQNIARHLVQGVDVWLNTPRRPYEASGTSGQKAALNGVLNVSILDGWWPEGFNGANGWAIGDETQLEDEEAQDAQDTETLFRLL